MDAMPNGARRYIKHVSTEEGVYGLILVSGLIAAAGIAHSSAGQILVIGTVTHVVFWLAHVYSGVVAGHGRRDHTGERFSLGPVIRHAMGKTKGMLLSAVIPGVFLALGALRIFDDKTAIWAALWSCVVVLAVLGFAAYRKLGANLVWCVVGALATASFGLIIVVTKLIVMH